ncbi:hypothetical protein Dimus_005150, partial [Dionaea muscipula]
PGCLCPAVHYSAVLHPRADLGSGSPPPTSACSGARSKPSPPAVAWATLAGDLTDVVQPPLTLSPSRSRRSCVQTRQLLHSHRQPSGAGFFAAQSRVAPAYSNHNQAAAAIPRAGNADRPALLGNNPPDFPDLNPDLFWAKYFQFSRSGSW